MIHAILTRCNFSDEDVFDDYFNILTFDKPIPII